MCECAAQLLTDNPAAVTHESTTCSATDHCIRAVWFPGCRMLEHNWVRHNYSLGPPCSRILSS
eukprot:3005191-Prymnesium_polylepis.1